MELNETAHDRIVALDVDDVVRMEWFVLQNGESHEGTVLLHLKHSNDVYSSTNIGFVFRKFLYEPDNVDMMRDMLANKHPSMLLAESCFRFVKSVEMMYAVYPHIHHNTFEELMLMCINNLIKHGHMWPHKSIIEFLTFLQREAIAHDSDLFYNHDVRHSMTDMIHIDNPIIDLYDKRIHAKLRYLATCVRWGCKWLFKYFLHLQTQQEMACKQCCHQDVRLLAHTIVLSTEFPLDNFVPSTINKRRISVSYLHQMFEIHSWIPLLMHMEREFVLYSYVNVWNGWWYKTLKQLAQNIEDDMPREYRRGFFSHLVRWLEHATLLRQSAKQEIQMCSGYLTNDILTLIEPLL